MVWLTIHPGTMNLMREICLKAAILRSASTRQQARSAWPSDAHHPPALPAHSTTLRNTSGDSSDPCAEHHQKRRDHPQPLKGDAQQLEFHSEIK